MKKKKQIKKQLTQDQLIKFESDAFAFLKTAQIIETEILTPKDHTTLANATDTEKLKKEISELKIHPLSIGGISLVTAMLTNLGLGIELMLKRIYYLTKKTHAPYKHELLAVYDKLSSNTKSELTHIFNDWLQEEPRNKNLAVSFIFSKTEPTDAPTDNHNIKDLRGLLNFFDCYGLYGKRYSYQNFSPQEWVVVISPTALAPLINKINEHYK